jgi:hypothetical protein
MTLVASDVPLGNQPCQLDISETVSVSITRGLVDEHSVYMPYLYKKLSVLAQITQGMMARVIISDVLSQHRY